MIQLPNDCWMSDFNVFPHNWKTGGAAVLKKNWYITYYFHDPEFKSDRKYKNGKLRQIKGMNKYKDLATRRSATEKLMEIELKVLQENEFNPIRGVSATPVKQQLSRSVTENSSLVEALDYGWQKIDVVEETRTDIKSCVKYVKIAAEVKKMANIRISRITKHMMLEILEECATERKMSPQRYNKYKSYLSMVFTFLEEHQMVKENPMLGIKEKKAVKKIRKVIDRDTLIMVMKELEIDNVEFHRFLQIFFHSGSRMKEISGIKKEDVNLKKLVFKVLVRKGGKYEEQLRPIKRIALPYWKELMDMAYKNQFLFAKGIVPGDYRISSRQWTIRWRVHVKQKLGVDEDIYTLKHRNLDEISALLEQRFAQKMAGHTSMKTTGIYTIGQEQREMELLRDLNNAI